MTTKLLAVDDSKTMRKVLEITFAGDKYDSTVVGSADEALAAIRVHPPQVVVVDAHLGNSSGYDLCKQIKDTIPSVKVMLLSSKQRPYDADTGSACGVDDHFDKPYDSTKFLDKLSQFEVAEPPPAKAEAPAVAVRPPAPSQIGAPGTGAVAPPATASPATTASPAFSPPASPPARPSTDTSTAPSHPAATSPTLQGSPGPTAPDESQQVSSPPSSLGEAAQTGDSVAAATGSMAEKLEGMGLTKEQIQGVLSLSREVVEQVVWEVVPALAETMIKEEIARLTAE